MQAYSMDLRERALLDSDAGMKAADVAVNPLAFPRRLSAALQPRGMPQLLSTLRLSGHHTVIKSALGEVLRSQRVPRERVVGAAVEAASAGDGRRRAARPAARAAPDVGAAPAHPGRADRGATGSHLSRAEGRARHAGQSGDDLARGGGSGRDRQKKRSGPPNTIDLTSRPRGSCGTPPRRPGIRHAWFFSMKPALRTISCGGMVGPSAGPASTTTRRAPGGRPVRFSQRCG